MKNEKFNWDDVKESGEERDSIFIFKGFLPLLCSLDCLPRFFGMSQTQKETKTQEKENKNTKKLVEVDQAEVDLAEGEGGVVAPPLVLHAALVVSAVRLWRFLGQGEDWTKSVDIGQGSFWTSRIQCLGGKKDWRKGKVKVLLGFAVSTCWLWWFLVNSFQIKSRLNGHFQNTFVTLDNASTDLET